MWRARLRLAIERSGRKHSAVAHAAGIAPETLSRILNGKNKSPSFDTILRLANVLDVRVGWILDERIRGVELSSDEQDVLRSAAPILLRLGAKTRS